MRELVLPEIALILLGGTITMTKGEGGGLSPTLSPQALLNAVPGLESVARIVPHAPFRVPGASLTMVYLETVAELIEAEVARGVAGAIVVQGTDTIEESAFVLDRMLDVAAPVIVTGAMRGPEAAGADGPANILASATVAAAPEASERGVMVVMNDEIHAARDVAKAHSGLCSAFVSRGVGPLGDVFEGQANFFRPGGHRLRALRRNPSRPCFPAVAVIKAALGEDGRLLDALPQLGYAGAVVEAMGAGHVPEGWSHTLGRLAGQMPVVLATRTGEGPVFSRTYGFKGAEIDLLSRGLISAGRLPALKARLLLQLALASDCEANALASFFDTA